MSNDIFARRLMILGVVTITYASAAVSAQQSTSLTANRFQASRLVKQVAEGSPSLLSKLSTGQRNAVSLVADDFFSEAPKSLITGYAFGEGGVISIQRGSVLPRPDEIDVLSPFGEATTFFDLGMRPDFLKSTDINGDGRKDLIVATRGGSTVRVLLGNGHGGFALQSPFSVRGSIASVAVWQNIAGQALIAVGVCGAGCSVDIYQGDGKRLASIPVDDQLTVLESARVNGSSATDIITGGSSKLIVIDGRTALASSPHIDRLPVSGAVSVATGSFVYDRRGLRQIAVLTLDGSVHTLARMGVESTPATAIQNVRQLIREHKLVRAQPVNPFTLGWFETETLAGAAPLGGATPLMMRTRTSGSGMDDLLVLNVNGGRATTIAHPVVAYPPGNVEPYAGTMQALAARIEIEQTPGGDIVAAVPLRISQDARLGFVTARNGATPEMSPLTATRTINVNTTADAAVTSAATTACTNNTAGCTLRAAFALVDSDGPANEAHNPQEADTVNIPAGTYTLGNFGPADLFGDAEYHIEIYGPVNVIGAGSASVFITTNNKDKVFSENSGNAILENDNQPPIDAYFSGITLQNGTNVSSASTSAITDFNGGLIDADTGGTGNITFSNCNFTNGTDLVGPGGALSVTDDYLGSSSIGPGTLEITDGTISGSRTDEYGGGVSAGAATLSDVPININGVTFNGNTANSSLDTSDAFAAGQGGAIYFDKTSDLNPDPESFVSNSTFSNNTAGSGIFGNGGGIYALEGLTITNNVFTGNSTTGTASSNPTAGLGGAVYIESISHAAVLTGNTFTSNSASIDGGAIWLFDSTSGTSGVPATIRYNVFSGNNVATASGRTGLAVGFYQGPDEGNLNALVTATDNFWGCNGAATGTGCDKAAEPAGTGTLTLTPYAVVTASLNTTTPPSSSTITLTGGITTDSNNTALGSGNLTAFTGLNAVMNISQNGSTLESATTPTNTSATASLSATATHGSGTATFAIDNAVVSLNFLTPAAITIAKAFGAASIASGGTTSLTFTLTNPAASSQSAIAFNDLFPAGLTIATPNGLTGTCNGTTTAAAGASSVSLSGATLAASSSCTILVTVTSSTPGAITNTTGSVSSTEGGTGGTASAPLTVNQITPVVTLTAPATANRGTASTLTATFTVPSGSPVPTTGMNFYAGTTLLGSSALVQVNTTTYTSSLSTAILPSGTQSITAVYPGDSAYVTATSNTQTTFVIANNLWIADSNGTTAAFSAIGTPYLTTPETSGGTGVAIDSLGDVWSLNTGSNSLAEFSNTGTVISAGFTGGGLSTPTSLAIDGSGQVWITNSNNSISVFGQNGQPISATPYTSSTLNSPTSITIDESGNLWIPNSTGNSVTEILGVAAPTISPLAAGVANNTTGTKP